MLASSEYLLYKELARNHWKKFRLQCVVTVGIALLIFSLTKSCKEETNTQDTWDSSDLVVIDTSLEES